MDAAADLLRRCEADRRGMILTTDADGRVGPRWITANLTAARSPAPIW